MNICESIVEAFVVELFEASGLLSTDEAMKLQHKIFKRKEVAYDDYEYKAEPVA